MRARTLQALIGILLVACNAPANGQTRDALRLSEATYPSTAQRATPTATIPPPVSFLGQYKIYTFDISSDFGFNQRWLFQAKSGGAGVNPNDFQGRLCFRARETKGIIREWGQVVKGEWMAFEGDPWKQVGDIWGLGVCLSASRLREAAEWGGMRTAEVVGIGAEERLAPVPTHPPISGVEQKYWTSIWSCNCSLQRDLRITNAYDFPVCLNWRMKGDQVVIWVSKN